MQSETLMVNFADPVADGRGSSPRLFRALGYGLIALVTLLGLLRVGPLAGLLPLLAGLGWCCWQQQLRLRALQDLTRQLERERDAHAELAQTKTQLLSVLAHDLRSPFISLKNIVWLLEQQRLSEADSASLLARARGQIDGLYGSLENLLLWARGPSLAERPVPVPLAALVAEVADLYTPALEQKGLELMLPAACQSYALIDPNVLRLVLRNLVDNAVKFTPAGGRIAIEILETAELRLRVRDSGVGMSETQLAALEGEPAVGRVSRGTNGEKGLGLGMGLCRNYLQRSGAHLNVTSRPGLGSCFEIVLPAFGRQPIAA